jgi:DinB superfamily
MECRDLLIDAFGRIGDSVHLTLDGLTPDQLCHRPDEEANSIAWLAWHLTRVQDDHVSDLAGQPQAWLSDGWHARFGKAADPGDTGFGYGPRQVAALRPADAQPLLGYFEAVHNRSVQYLQQVEARDLDRVLDEPQWDPRPTVGVRLISVIDDCLEHAGQMAYVRGLLERRHWFPA